MGAACNRAADNYHSEAQDDGLPVEVSRSSNSSEAITLNAPPGRVGGPNPNVPGRISAPNARSLLGLKVEEASPTSFGEAGGQNRDTAERLRHYEERKEARRKRRSEGVVLQPVASPVGVATGKAPAFLSNVPEIDADIDFRFSFMLMGMMTANVVSAAARSSTYKSLCHLHTENRDGRLLAPVPFPITKEASVHRMKLAKLLMLEINKLDGLPHLNRRVEALSSALIFIFNIDDSGTYQEQLQNYEDAVYALRTQPRKFRYARAVLFVTDREFHSDEGESTPRDKWMEFIEEYELVHGPLWKFGPCELRDSEGLYGVFASIASTRISKIQSSAGSDSDGSHISMMPPVYEGEVENWEEDEEDMRTASSGLMVVGSTKQPWMSKLELGAA